MPEKSDFYVVAREPGHTDPDLPVWACATDAAITFNDMSEHPVVRVELPEVPGAFKIMNLLSESECDQLVHISDMLGYHDDAPVSLPRHIRHNYNFNWVVDESVDHPIWQRCYHLFDKSTFSGFNPVGLNARFRFYRYSEGDYFAPHTDGAWPGSRVRGRQLIADAYGDRVSEMTLLIFLNDGYQGGRTLFQSGTDSMAAVATPKGAALVFPHGMHPQHCVHAGKQISSGQKNIIRTDVLFG